MGFMVFMVYGLYPTPRWKLTSQNRSPRIFGGAAGAKNAQIIVFFGVLLFFFRAFSWSSQGNSLAKSAPDKISEGRGRQNAPKFISFSFLFSFLSLRTSFESALTTREKLVEDIIQFFTLYNEDVIVVPQRAL